MSDVAGGTQQIPPAMPAQDMVHGHSHDSQGFFIQALDSIKNALEGNLTLGVGISVFALAFAVGALHSMQPGHGKTLVAAYLVGVRGTFVHAVFLGLVVTLTHSLSVVVIGGLLAYFSGHFLRDSLQGWLGAVSGMLLSGTGLWLLISARRRLALRKAGVPDSEITAACGHDHGGHSHTPDGSGHPQSSHGHGHAHDTVSLPALISLGIAGGIVPCLDAVLIILAAFSIGRPAFGLLIILGFSLGIASVLVLFGILLVKTRSRLRRNPLGAAWMARMPVLSAVVIVAMGLLILITGVSNLGH